ncbi:MAG: preprotein translocase subunit YajC [Lentisphaeria bacterium]|nr:preprotein translocase subunit YajC [Lentisphaeria bacterium]
MLHNFNYLLAQTAEAGQPSLITSMIPFILMIAIFFFIMIRPQQKKQKRHEEMLRKLKSGDKVVTVGGIYGEIFVVKDKTIVVQVDEKTRFEMDKNSISRVLEQGEEEK